jgi:hypothetical protein
MDERIQGGLKEGAGLEESRLNTEFIEFLRKWSTPLLVVVAAIAGSYFLWGKYQASRDAAMASAFASFDAAVVSRKPESLIQVAEEQSGKAAVPYLARLAAADLYLESSRSGIPAGLQLDAMGALPEGTAFLTEDEKKSQLTKAAAQYQIVADDTAGDDGMAIHSISALFGLASVAESQGDMEMAKSHYTRLAEVAKRVGFTREAAAAEKRIENLPTLDSMPRIYAKNDLFVVKSAVNPIEVKTPDGSVVTVEGGAPKPGTATPGAETPATPEVAPTPSPAPAPTPEPAPQPAPATPPANPGR